VAAVIEAVAEEGDEASFSTPGIIEFLQPVEVVVVTFTLDRLAGV